MKLHSLTVALVAMSTLSVACGDKSDDTADTGHADHDDGGEETGGEETGGEETGGEETGGEETGGEEGGTTGGDTTGGGDGDAACVPDESATVDVDGYFYDSHIEGFEGDSAVSNNGQIMRQLLITELKGYIGDLKNIADAGGVVEGDVVDGLNYYFDFDSAAATDGFYHAPENALQATWGDISTKSLKGKIAGNDAATDHRVWTGADSEFYGWDGVNSPEELVQHWFGELETQVLAYQEAEAGDAILDLPPYVTADGVDRKQLIQKFLTGAVTFSQGADDYLSNDVDGKGLLASEDCATEDDGTTCKKYTGIGHAWDEGFGYFGGARNYGFLTPDEIKANENDANGDGCIDLKTEYNWGGSVNAAKRDVGSAALPDTADHSSFVADAWTGFYDGRTLIADALSTAGTLTDAQKETLLEHRDLAVNAWEGAIAATVVHYINDVQADLLAASPSSAEEFSFEDYAKHWGEAKGFALWFQFNPNSPMLVAGDDGVEHFQTLHQKLGMTAPKWTPDGGGDFMAWNTELTEAKKLLGDAYGFTEAQLENW